MSSFMLYLWIRRIAFLLISLSCLSFAASVLLGYEDCRSYAMWPGIMGVAGSIVIFGAARIMGDEVASQVWDELSRHEWGQAIRIGYWFAIALYPIFGFLVWQDVVDFRQAFASMGTLTGGVPLLCFVLLDIQGR